MIQKERLGKQSFQHLQKLRLTKNEVCKMLSVARDKLSKMEKDDPTFPRSMKDGDARQSAVYYDYNEIMDWYENWKVINKISYS
ncbi:hypothetical protein [Acinetobacter ursingii]|uniref:hypothetical protein n=1 Tax=Acinetobacter ursingii TaxID=108980 RepID=UPI0005C988EF|nr:hypothetical protein [Acinetobacter ursingii]